MKYAFLTMLFPKQKEGEIRRLSRQNMQDAANALQWHIYEGLCENHRSEIKIFNVRPIGSFPQYYVKPFVKQTSFSTDNCKENVDIGFCNVKFIRKLHQPRRIYRQLLKWCKSDDEEKCLIVYTMSAPFMLAASKLKKQFPKLKTCAIVADLPDMSSLSSNQSLAQKIFNKKAASIAYAKAKHIDAFVLLTKEMANYMSLKKPFCVMEGISAFTDSKETVCLPDEKYKTILYTGTLHKKFGVLNLLDAFSHISDSNYRLVICGVGDSEERIKQAAEQDGRICFMGQVTREEALELQKKATVLVNPRQNNEEFTKYSFPSKNLEYLSSGTPFVAYKLDGIPDEYDEYINYVADDSTESLAGELVRICELPQEVRYEMGRRAQIFVLEEKNAKKQTEKILDLLESI